MNAPFYIGVVICITIAVVVIATYAALIPKDSSQNSTLLTVVISFSFVASIVAYGLAFYFFKSNPANMVQFLLAITMLVLLPASLTSMAVSTITISNLRDTLAAAT